MSSPLFALFHNKCKRDCSPSRTTTWGRCCQEGMPCWCDRGSPEILILLLGHSLQCDVKYCHRHDADLRGTLRYAYTYMLRSTSLDIWRQVDVVWYTSLVTAYLDWCSGAAPFPFRSSTTVQFMRSPFYIPRFQAEHGHTTVGSRCACGTSVTASVSAQNQCKTTNSEIIGSPACFLQEIYTCCTRMHIRESRQTWSRDPY